MATIFTITTDLIKKLNDSQARELVARLCKAELRAQGLTESGVTWGGDQRAKDGGVDVRIECNQPLTSLNYIKHQNTAIQVKAEKFSPSKIPNEMAPKGNVRSALIELGTMGGAYIIVSTRDDLSDSSLLARKTKISAVLKAHGLEGKIDYDFYDARQIADWVEQHPALANWVRHELGQSFTGWQPYGSWAYHEDDVSDEYLVDERVRVFVLGQDKGSDINSAIEQLRSELSQPASVRIVGLSGVGKTRLAQALFDVRIGVAAKAPSPDNVVYTDLADEPTPQPKEMLEELVSRDSDCVVVIDNCGSDTHQRLTEIIKRKGSQLRLLTIEYDIRDDLPESTSCFRLEGVSNQIIRKLLEHRYQILSGNDTRKIAEFSDGNARVAFALASTANTNGEMAKLQDAELFKRLFHQKNNPNDDLLRCAEIASLLYSFDGEDMSETSEVALLANIAETTPRAFSRHMAELQRRGLLQQRSKWRAILPHAISNGLALRAINSLLVKFLLTTLLTDASDRIARSFTRRLGFLHEDFEAQQIAQQLLNKSGRLGNLSKLNEFEIKLFLNIAPIDQNATIEALERAIEINNFVSVDNAHRATFAKVARKLAYEAQYFDRASTILEKFSLVEPEEYNHDSVKDKFRSLFHSHLSGTTATVDQRLAVVKRLLSSDSNERQQLGLRLLDAALEAGHFSSIDSIEFGARPRDYGWYPRTREDVKSWYVPWIGLAVEFGCGETNLARDARVLLAENARSIWTQARLSDEIVAAAESLSRIEGWPEGWRAVRRILRYDKDELDEKTQTKLKKLESFLTPSDLKSQITAKVLAKGRFGFDFEDDDQEISASIRDKRSQKSAEQLGEMASKEPNLVFDLLPELIKRDASAMKFEFGLGVGKSLSNVPELLGKLNLIIKDADPPKINLIFIRGIIRGWNTTDPEKVNVFLDRAVYDPIWQQWFVALQCCLDLDDIAFARLNKLLDGTDTPTYQFSGLSEGRATAPLTPGQIFQLLDKIRTREDHGVNTALNILRMVIYGLDEKNDAYKKNLSKKTIAFLYTLDWSIIVSDYVRLDDDIEVILNFALGSSASENDVIKILHNIVELKRSKLHIFSYGRGKIFEPFFVHFPILTLDAIYQADEDGSYASSHRMVTGSFSDRRETAIAKVPADIFIGWCDVSPDDRYTFAAETCQLFEETGKDNKELKLSDTAMQLFKAAPDKSIVLKSYLSRFYPSSWFGSLADILEQRLPLLNEIAVHDDNALQQHVSDAKDELSRRIALERKIEDNEERSRTASFE